MGSDLGDGKSVDWSQVTTATFRITQGFHYEYPAPIRDLRHRLVVVPRARHGGQERLMHDVEILPRIPARHHADRFGNQVTTVEADYLCGRLDFRHFSVVRRTASKRGQVVKSQMWWDPELNEPRRLIRSDVAIRDAAADLRREYADDREFAAATAAFVHAKMEYAKGETDVFTTASTAFAMRRGVCQDFSHVTIALLRAEGIACRYVSGHLLGEGATHAWVEVLLPEGDDRAAVLAYDPTHGCVPSLRYVVVAVGRDYDDIAPTSGTFLGARPGILRATQYVTVTDVA